MVKLFTAPETAAQLQIELDTLYRYARSGDLRGVKVGKVWRFTADDIRDFISARGHHPPTEDHAPRLLQNALRNAAKESGDQTKFICGTERLSYAEIDRYSDGLANRLVARHVRSGDRIILGLPNSAAFVIACFAIWKARAVVVALDPAMRSTNLQHILERTEPTALIAQPSFVERVQEMPGVLRFFRVFFLKDPSAALPETAQIAVESLQTELPAISKREHCRPVHGRMTWQPSPSPAARPACRKVSCTRTRVRWRAHRLRSISWSCRRPTSWWCHFLCIIFLPFVGFLPAFWPN